MHKSTSTDQRRQRLAQASEACKVAQMYKDRGLSDNDAYEMAGEVLEMASDIQAAEELSREAAIKRAVEFFDFEDGARVVGKVDRRHALHTWRAGNLYYLSVGSSIICLDIREQELVINQLKRHKTSRRNYRRLANRLAYVRRIG